MMEFQEKRRLKNFFYCKFTLFVLLVIVIWLANAVWNVYKKQDYTKVNLAKTAASLEGLQAREKMLSSEIERLKTKDGTEAEIREKYGLVKPGEEVIVVIDEGDTNHDITPAPAGFWQRIMDWFK